MLSILVTEGWMSEVSCGTGYEGRILVCFGEPYVLEWTLLSRDFTKEEWRKGTELSVYSV